MGIVLLAIVALSIFGGENFSGWALWGIGVPNIIIFIIYLIGTRRIFVNEKKRLMTPTDNEPSLYEEFSLRKAYIKFATAAAAVIATGIWLSYVGDEISETYNWSASFVGSLFLAITTSLPELVVAITAARIGAIDMAVADIFGANMLDIMSLMWADIFYTRGPILMQPCSIVSGVHVYTAIIAAVMTFVVILGLRFQRQKKLFVVMSWYGPLLLGLYIFGAYVLFTSGIC
jgi:cation:H+ antiporter